MFQGLSSLTDFSYVIQNSYEIPCIKQSTVNACHFTNDEVLLSFTL